jgi:xanthine dehydrogenase accessory factor
MSRRWHEALRDAIERNGRAALVVIAHAAGSTPREAGTAMVVTHESISGTIGGGHLEYEATRLAREALAGGAGAAPWLVRLPLAARLGQCCGGVATLAFATFDRSASAWLDAVAACARTAEPFVVASSLGRGEADAGRLIVTADDVRGTLDDAALEARVTAEARARLALAPGEPQAASGLIAIDTATLLLQVERPCDFTVCVFGNGHVGRALVHVLGAVPVDVRWIDSRENDFPADVPANVEVVATDAPEAEVAAAPRGACLVVMTHSHALDFDIVEAALARPDLRYLGLIGSRSKRAQFERRLAARGLPAQTLARVTCPIGAGPLRSKEPGVIAVAIAAELLAIREASHNHVEGLAHRALSPTSTRTGDRR